MAYKIYFKFQFEPNSVCQVHVVLKDLVLFDHSILVCLEACNLLSSVQNYTLQNTITYLQG